MSDIPVDDVDSEDTKEEIPSEQSSQADGDIVETPLDERVEFKPQEPEQTIIPRKPVIMKMQEVVHFPNVFHRVMQFIGEKDLVRCSNVATKWREFIDSKKMFENECRRIWANESLDVSRYDNNWKAMLLDSNRQNVKFPHVFFDLSVNKQSIGRVLMQVSQK
jgi:hypothetical protein